VRSKKETNAFDGSSIIIRQNWAHKWTFAFHDHEKAPCYSGLSPTFDSSPNTPRSRCSSAHQKLCRTIILSSHPTEPMVDDRRLSDTGPGNDCNDIYLLVCSWSRKAISSSRPKTSLPVTGNLATETFSGPSLADGSRVTARESAGRIFCKL
jgi:hypothetical protein